jgi:predicted amidohydrolase
MSTAFTAACVQVTAGPEIGPNIDIAETLIREARAEGADLVLTPETSDLMEPDGKRLAEKVEPEGRHIGLRRMRDLAQALACWILVGSFLVATRDGRPANRSFLIGPEGEVRARYDKIHMFDVDIPDGQRYRESRRFNPGAQAVVAETPWARLGLSICYDLRFPQLYRSLAAAGASVLTSPSAFTRFTGKAHWHVLIRTRAIETGSYVLAPAQCGRHAGGRETYGHSLIVSPWGEVLAEAGNEPGVILAEIDPDQSRRAREAIPALAGARDFTAPGPKSRSGSDGMAEGDPSTR